MLFPFIDKLVLCTKIIFNVIQPLRHKTLSYIKNQLYEKDFTVIFIDFYNRFRAAV